MFKIADRSSRRSFPRLSVPRPDISVFVPAEKVESFISPEVRRFVRHSLAESTLRSYSNDLRHFLNWGGTIPTEDTIIAEYLSSQATTHASATLVRRVTAINKAHHGMGITSPGYSPLVTATLRGIRRLHGKPQRRVRPLTKERLFLVLSKFRDDQCLKAIRDRALLLLGFAGAFRTGELRALDMADLTPADRGVVVELRKGKTDPFGQGRKVAIPYAHSEWCPVHRLSEWINCSGISEGPVFRRVDPWGNISRNRFSDSSGLAWVIKNRISAAGFSRDQYSGHSLRAGFVTSALTAGIQVYWISAQTGHKDERSVRKYHRDADLFANNAAGALL